jgi:diadenosine tetraphosphate (Ap4A) HIT family hydrolase
MMMISQRHVAGPAHFNDREAESFGPSLRHFQLLLERVTGALRIYTAAMGESAPHFHAHMVPRYATMPKDAKAWGVFDLQRAAAAGEIAVDEAEIRRVSELYRAALIATPPPLSAAVLALGSWLLALAEASERKKLPKIARSWALLGNLASTRHG